MDIMKYVTSEVGLTVIQSSREKRWRLQKTTKKELMKLKALLSKNDCYLTEN